MGGWTIAFYKNISDVLFAQTVFVIPTLHDFIVINSKTYHVLRIIFNYDSLTVFVNVKEI